MNCPPLLCNSISETSFFNESLLTDTGVKSLLLQFQREDKFVMEEKNLPFRQAHCKTLNLELRGPHSYPCLNIEQKQNC